MVEKECSIKSGDAVLKGTACLPKIHGRFPVVLMIHGSGPLDRDENIDGQGLNIFNAIAHHLADNGIASVRYDKRGCGESTGNYYSAGHFDLVEDAVQWFDSLDGFEFCDQKRKYLLGHSEGCIIAPQVNLKRPAVAGMILLAPFIESLETHGLIKGFYLGFRRISKCHPVKFLGGSSGLDLVPKKENLKKKY